MKHMRTCWEGSNRIIKTKTAFITIIGKPNAGKSSLLNKLVGEKVAIISNKPQTTRTKIIGIKTKNEQQFVFIDTPGIHKLKTKLDIYMENQVKQSLLNIDLIVVIVEVKKKDCTLVEQKFIDDLKDIKTNKILVLNKIDLLKKKQNLIKYMDFFSKYGFDAIIPISALTGEGIDSLWQQLNLYTKESVHFFPDDMVTDQPKYTSVAEIVREKLLSNLREELPDTVAVVTEKIEQRNKNSKITDIEIIIYCEKIRHKAIIIGKDGQMLKKVATDARIEMEQFLNCKINLQCWVKTKENWRNKQQVFAHLGFN